MICLLVCVSVLKQLNDSNTWVKTFETSLLYVLHLLFSQVHSSCIETAIYSLINIYALAGMLDIGLYVTSKKNMFNLKAKAPWNIYVCLFYDPRGKMCLEVDNAILFFKQPHKAFDHVSRLKESGKKKEFYYLTNNSKLCFIL